MDANKTTLERAFELARSGQYQKLGDILEKLHSEGYYPSQMEGTALRKQLRSIMAAAKSTDD